VAPDPERASDHVGTDASRETVARIAGEAVTALRALDRPKGGDRIVIVSDFDRVTTPGKLACPGESCGLTDERWQSLTQHGPTLVEAAIFERFGPEGTGVVNPNDIGSVTFCQLRELYQPQPPTPTAVSTGAPTPGAGPSVTAAAGCDPSATPEVVRAQLADADWIVFAFADLNPTDVRDLRGLLLPQVNAFIQTNDRTRLAVLSFGPPYYVDQTNFFHLDSFIAAYSKIPASIDAAVAALFGELEPRGTLPVDYEDADLILADELSPDPAQKLALRLVSPDAPGRDGLPAEVVAEIGPVLDRGGHPVPDGTVFAITADPPSALGAGKAPEARTVGAVARVEVTLIDGGAVTLRAVGDTVSSDPLRIELPVPTPTPSPTVPPAATSAPGPRPGSAARAPDLADLSGALTVIALTSGVAFVWSRRFRTDTTAQLRTGLLVAAGGLLGYLVLAVPMRLDRVALSGRHAAAPGGAALVGALVVLCWRTWRTRRLTATETTPAQPPAS
jgi:hypothetical protein